MSRGFFAQSESVARECCRAGGAGKGIAGPAGGRLNRLTAEIIDDWCPMRPHKFPFPPRPHWAIIVEQLGLLAERFPTGSVLSEAAFDLARRLVNRAHEAHKQVDSR